MNLDLSILDRLEQALNRIEEACPEDPAEPLRHAVAEAHHLAADVRRQWVDTEEEVQILAKAQADALVNSEMVLTELQETKEVLEVEIAEREEAQRRLRHDALHDPLTGLPNRALLKDRLGQCVERAKRQPDYLFAVLFLDIDNFKLINDSLGHTLGDKLLIETGRRLLKGLRSLDTVVRGETDTTARLGGDEFIILLDDIRKPGDVLLVVERIQRQLAPPILLDGHEAVVNASIGILHGQGSCGSVEDLLRDADTAMYRAKAAGKARYAVFNQGMHAQAMARLELENALRSAMEQREFEILYHPIVELGSGRIGSVEALLRWNHPQRGTVYPAEFIPLAEETGMIIPIGRWVLREACCQLRTWRSQMPAELTPAINVNISKRQLVEPFFVQELKQILHQTGLEGADIGLEITESTVMDPSEAIARVLREVKQLGTQLHMDDFGTGYSSLSCLHNLPLDVVKIDRAFIAPMETSRKYAAIVCAIITLAQNLNMQVTAEGIETKEQLAQLISLDCQHAQGYFFSEPVPAAELAELLSSKPPWIIQAVTASQLP